MVNRPPSAPARLAVLLFLVFALMSAGVEATYATTQLPTAILSRLKKIDQHMEKVEAGLQEGRVDQINIRAAQRLLQEIDDQYKQHADAPEVKAVRDRVQKGLDAIAKMKADEQGQKDQDKQKEKEQEAALIAWADKLSAYKTDTSPGAKGDFGVPASDVDTLLKTRAHYEEAKKLLAEFEATGIAKDSHYQLRDAHWDITSAIKGYDDSVERLLEGVEKDAGQCAQWIKGQKTSATPLTISFRDITVLREKVSAARRLLTEGDKRRQGLDATMAQVEKDQAEVEKVVLKSRKMKADLYKGGDAQAIKGLAQKLVVAELTRPDYSGKAGKVLRVHVISAIWNTESAVEWTDTTKSAVQYRVTKGVNVQVAAKVGADCFLFTLFVHKDNVSGSQSGLLGHIMFRDKFLEANLPK